MENKSVETLENLIEVLPALKELTEVLTEEHIARFIDGVEEAKVTLESATEVEQQRKDALQSEEDNRLILADIQEQTRVLKKQEIATNNSIEAEKKLKQENADAKAENEKAAGQNKTDKADNDTRDTELKKKEATIQSDLDDAADAKKKAQERLRVLNGLEPENVS